MKNITVGVFVALSFLLLPVAPAFAQLGDIVTTPADTTPPIISGVVESSLLPTGITLAWTTDELATSQLRYGLTASYGSTLSVDASGALAHTATLTGLSPSTTYHYCIDATDLAGNTASACSTFATAAALDVTAPIVSLVAAAPVSTSTATITWTTSENANAQVQYGTTASYGLSSAPDTTLALAHSVTLADLSPDTTYHYRVLSRDAAGNLVTGTDATFTTGALPVATSVTVTDTTPPVITGVSSVSLEPSTATIIWTTSELATSTLAYGTTMSYGSSATLPLSALLAHSATLTGLTAGTTYYFCIRATDLFGNTADDCTSANTFTTAAVQTTIDTMPPTISLASVASVATTSASVSWTTDEVATGYVEYGTSASYGSQTTLDGAFTLTHGASLTGLTPNTTYHYRVVSSDASGNTALSPDNTFTTDALATVAVTTPPDTTPPSITNIIAAPIGGTQSGINWTTDKLATATLEYGTTTSYGLSASVSSTALLSHTTTLFGLAPNTTYYYCIHATDAAGHQANSCGHSFTTLATPVVVDPAANIIAVSSSLVGTSSASVSWTTDENTSGTVRYGLTTAYETDVLSDTTLGTAHTITLSSLLPGTTYHFRVKAVDHANNITYSDDHTFTTSGTAPSGAAAESVNGATGGGSGGGAGASGPATPAPTPALITAAAADSQIIFLWRNPSTGNFAGTTIVRKADGYPSSPTDGEVIYSGNSRTFTDTNLVNGTTYYYSLYSKNAAGQYSNPLRVSEAPAAGVHQVQLNENPVLQPALAIEHLTADMKRGDTGLEVVHLQQVLNTVNVHPSALTTGYFGPLTESALKEFQAKYSLPQTGAADAATRTVLNSLSQGWMVIGASSNIATVQTDLKRGDSGAAVASLQTFLAYEGSYTEGIISGYFGPLTQKAVADFQKKFGVTPVSGYVGYKTRHTIQTVLGL